MGGRFFKLSNSFIIVLILIALLLIAMSVSFAIVAHSFLVKEELNKASIISKYIRDRVEENKNQGSGPLSAIISNMEIINAFRDQNRDKLIALTDPIWNNLKERGFTQFQFNLAEPAVVFLRLHNREQFGDDFSNYRPALVKTVLTGLPVAGLEQGHSGYGFRSVVPATWNGRVIGAVELGADFGPIFLEYMNRTFPGTWGIYNLKRGVRSIDDTNLVAFFGDDKDTFPNLPLSDDIMEKMKIDVDAVKMDSIKRTVSTYVPVRNFQGDVAAVIKHEYTATFYAKLRQMIVNAIVIASVGLALSVFVILILYRQITVPLKKLAAETEKIQNFNLEEPIIIKAHLYEIRALIDATQRMKIGLQSFRKFVPAELVRQLIQTYQEAKIHGERREIAIMFTDIANFSTISENCSPRELTAQLSNYLDELTKIIIAHQGTVDKYIGDAVMAFWGAPTVISDHILKSCIAAVECRKKTHDLNRQWKQDGKYEFKTRFGIHAGDVIVGNIGSEQRLSYTVIGDAVNIASRLEGLSKIYGTEILISETVYDSVKREMIARRLDSVLVKGRNEPLNIFELIGEKDDVSASDIAFYRDFEKAMQTYGQREWESAAARFESLLKRKSGDRPSELFLERCRNRKDIIGAAAA
jgi:class 3 adenylate cyclase